MKREQAAIAALTKRIEDLRRRRDQMKLRIAQRQKQHQSTGELAAKLRTMTTAELKAALQIERKRFRITNRTGRKSNQRAAARKRAKAIAEQLQEAA